MPRPPDPRAERALARAQNDPDFEVALRAAYRGRHDVLDALWWAAHPLTRSPRGVADPATGLRELQREVYSRAAAESPLAEEADSEHRLRQEQRLLSGDAEDLADALATVGAVQLPAAEERPEVQQQRGLNLIAVPSRSITPERNDPRRKILLPALAGMGLLSIILLLPTLSELDAGAGGDASPPLTTAPRITTEIVTLGSAGHLTDPLAILERPQRETDRPPAGFPTGMPMENFRALPNLVAHLRLYLTRDDDRDSVCLVAVQPDDLGISGCIPESDFADSGLHLGGGRYPIDDYTTILTESYSLLPNGEFRYEATARVRAHDAP